MSFNGDVSLWDVSAVTDMSFMVRCVGGFRCCGSHKQQKQFFSAESFNGDISSWDVTAVTDMRRMVRRLVGKVSAVGFLCNNVHTV